MTKKIELLSNNQINFKSLVKLCLDKNSSVKWLQENNLSKPSICSHGHEINLQLSGKKYRWRCRKNGCGETYGKQKGKFFFGKHPSTVDEIVFFLNLFKGI